MDGLGTALIIIVGLPVAGLSVIIVAFIFRSWSLKTRELKLKEEQFRLEARLRQESMNERMLTSHESSLAASHLDKMEAELINMRAEISDLKTRLAAFAGTGLSSSQGASTDCETEERKMME